jgi:drug/metabolite transporter (DMT)-like permease
MMEISQLHILIGWGSMIMGALSGALIGLFFHRDEWAGGYASFRRRMMRLGHIAFFGLGILNLLFAYTTQSITLTQSYLAIASTGFIVAVIAMPLCCFLTAWRKPFRHLFPIPVLGVLAGVVPIVLGGIGS